MNTRAEVERTLWGLEAARFTGKMTLHFKDGRILQVEETKTVRLTGETDPSRQSSPAHESTGETDQRRPVRTGRARDGSI